MFDSLSISDVMGYMSIVCWLGAQFPQVIENIKLKSCEGLALPFLANWLLGDISNLVGCILTHQLPFQTYLATYFVCVDCILVIQYYYYYKPPKGPPSALGHIRSASSPAIIRRMSIDRGASRYRAISAAASNVAAAAAAAALASRQDERADRRSSRYSRFGRPPVTGESNSASRTRDDDEEEEIPSAMIDSFRSERAGREHSSKRVSWSIERHRGRAASVGQVMGSPPVNKTADESLPLPQSAEAHPESSLRPKPDSNETLSPVISSRGSRATRKGSTMVFLSVWTLFGFGTLVHQRAPSGNAMDVGHILASTNMQNTIPIALGDDNSFLSRGETDPIGLELGSGYWILDAKENKRPDDPNDDPHEDPSSEQILGRIFAWLCTTLYLTSRLPQIWKNYVRKSVEGLSMYLFIFAFLGNCFYVSSILLSPRRFLPPPQSTQFIRESIPYLLGSGGTLVFDMTIVGQSFCFKPRHKRHSTAHVRVLDEEEAGLLSGDALSAHPDSSITNRGRTSRIHNP